MMPDDVETAVAKMGEVAALMVMARRTLRGVATPRELVDFARYDYWPPPARRLSEYERLAGDLAMMYYLYDEDVACDDDEADAEITTQAGGLVPLADQQPRTRWWSRWR